MTFNVYGPFSSPPTNASCTSSSLVKPFSPDTVKIGPGPTPQSATSDPFTPSATGNYAWIATYNPTGVRNGNPVSTKCGDGGELLVVASIPKITAFGFTNTPTNNDPTLGSGTVAYSVTIPGQTVSATISATFTDTNGITGAVSGSPTTYTFTIQTK